MYEKISVSGSISLLGSVGVSATRSPFVSQNPTSRFPRGQSWAAPAGAGAVPGKDVQASGEAGVARRLQVVGPVPHHPGGGEIEGQHLGGAQQHARIGLARRVVGVVVGRPALGVVGAGEDTVDESAVRRQVGENLLLNPDEGVPAVMTVGDPGLVGDHDHGNAAGVGRGDDTRRPGNQAGVLDPLQEADLVDEDAVAVQEQGGPLSPGPFQDLHPHAVAVDGSPVGQRAARHHVSVLPAVVRTCFGHGAPGRTGACNAAHGWKDYHTKG